jgi:hypothetical protein
MAIREMKTLAFIFLPPSYFYPPLSRMPSAMTNPTTSSMGCQETYPLAFHLFCSTYEVEMLGPEHLTPHLCPWLPVPLTNFLGFQWQVAL